MLLEIRFFTISRMIKALKQFTLSIVSSESKYDRVKAGTDGFTALEQSGYSVFQQKCAGCHAEPLFTDLTYRNIGLPIDAFLKDAGRMQVTGNSNDSLKFKVPTLRNVMTSSYYTHDGRFPQVSHMLAHYRTGVQPGPTLDPLVQNGIALTDAEANAITAFLRTLTDSSLLDNSRYKAPQ